MLLAWDNKADAATVSAGSQIATLPATNVQQVHLSRKWHTAAGVKDSYLIFDLTNPIECSVLAVLGTNLTASATLRLRASDVDPTVTANLLTDTGVVSAGVKTDYGAIYRSITPALTARYWRVDLADATLPDNLQVGRVFLGPSWRPQRDGRDNPQEHGWFVEALDDSVVTESYGLQTYSEVRPQRRQLTFTLNWLDEAEMYGNAFAAARALGRVGDLLAVQDSLGGTHLSEQSVYGPLQEPVSIVHAGKRIFRTKFVVKERL